MGGLIRISEKCEQHLNPENCACENVINFKIVVDLKKYMKYKEMKYLSRKELIKKFPIAFQYKEIQNELLEKVEYFYVYSQ